MNSALVTITPDNPRSTEDHFESVSVVIPVINEVRVLEEIVNLLFESAGRDVQELILIVCSKTTPASLETCARLGEKYHGRIRVIPQKLPFLGGALREGFEAAQGSHVLVLFSDGEANPAEVQGLISEAKNHPKSIISASRWLKPGSFERYPFLKTILNFAFQKAFALFVCDEVTDFTFGYRLYPTSLIRIIRWRETGHSFVFESILVPIRLGIKIREIPTIWKARAEGKSQLKARMYLRYLWVGLRTQLVRRQYLLRSIP